MKVSQMSVVDALVCASLFSGDRVATFTTEQTSETEAPLAVAESGRDS